MCVNYRDDWWLSEVINTTIVVLVIMRRYEVVNLGNTSGLHHSSQTAAVPILPTVYQEGLSTWRNDKGCVSLVHINVIDAKRLSISDEGACEGKKYREGETHDKFPFFLVH